MCLVDRENKKRGFCKSGENVKIALSSKFFYEEPCISGTKGSGAVFFSNCNLRCVYCQNYKISKEGKGCPISNRDSNKSLKQNEKEGQN